MVAALPGGISAAEVAREAGRIVVSSPVLPAASSNGASSNGADSNGARTDDEQLRKERKDAGVTAILHDSAPVRYWDHDLGPDQPRLRWTPTRPCRPRSAGRAATKSPR